jgi:hypothetical protein
VIWCDGIPSDAAQGGAQLRHSAMADDIPLDDVKCPNCGELIPISQTIYHQIADRVRDQLKAETLEQRKALTLREKELRERESAIEQTVAEQLTLAKAQLQNEADKKARDAVAVEIADLRQQATEKHQQLETARHAELELRRQKRELEDREKALELETARRIDAERQKIRDETARRLQEEHWLRDAEKDKKLGDVLKANEELRRRLEQGSQQTQGEVLELEFEVLLRTAFPIDVIEPVPKGVGGADVVQKVINKGGQHCGTILWELKRTKAWSDAWIPKLRDDQRLVKADLAIIVSEALPKECTNFKQINGVWVSNPQCAINLAIALRLQLEQVAMTRLGAIGKNEKMEVIYQYLSGAEFRQRVEAIVETFIDLQDDLLEERRVAERRWSKREKQIQKVISNTSGMYGDLQALIGSSLQNIPALTDGGHTTDSTAD